VGNVVTNESIARVINKLLTNITKKQENVEKLRKNYANMKHKNTAPKKLKFVQNEINRRNTEIRNMVKEMNKYNKFMKVNKSKRATAASKITAASKGRLTRKYTNILKAINKSKKQTKKLEQNAQNLINKRSGNVNKIDKITHRKRLAEQKKVIDRFLGKLAQDTRSTVKQKYKILTRLMEPNPEFNFLGEAGVAEDLANALGRRGLVCHLEGKNAKFVEGYLPMLRESLYVLSKQYLDQYDAKNAADKKIFHRTFFNKVVNKAAYPCLEGTFTGMTEAIVEPAFNWTGKYGFTSKEIVNGKEIITKNPYNFNKSKDVEEFVHVLIGLSLGPYYETLSSNMKTKYQNKSKKEQLKFMWDYYKQLELSHGRGGYLTYMGEIKNNEGRKVRQAFVNSFKEYGNYIYENNVNHDKEINALKISDL
jgi:HAMP domain-containing protein